MAEEDTYTKHGYRWTVLVVYGLVMCVQAFLWLSFAPIESSVQDVLGKSATMIGLLALVGPFMFIIVASPAGALSDRRGWRYATSIGVVMLIVAAAIKAVTPHVTGNTDVQYWVYLLMQVLGGTGAVFAMVNLSKMPIKWFPEKQRALANGLTTMSMYLGAAIGLPLVTAIAAIPEGASRATATAGLNRVLLVMAIIMGVVGVLFFLLSKEAPPTPAGPEPEVETLSLRETFPRFMRSAQFRVLCLVSLVGYGVYISLTVTMEKLMTYHGFTTSFAAFVAAGITMGGIVGAAVIPGISEKVGLRKPFLILAAAPAIPGLLILAFVGSKPLALITGIIMGFCLLPALPVTFTIVGEMPDIGPKLAATAVGTLLAVGSIGSAFVPLLVRAMGRKQVGDVIDYRIALVLLAALTAVALALVIAYVKETGPKREGAVTPESE
ncbi:MAG: MFS transporter [Actinomycetota bacterium]